jgi:hypothetical protein
MCGFMNGDIHSLVPLSIGQVGSMCIRVTKRRRIR